MSEGTLPAKDHLAFVRQLPCCVCGRDAEPHHLLRVPGGKRGMGKRNDDCWAIPLCRPCHSGLHLNGDEIGYLKEKKIDGVEIAKQLFANTGDFDKAFYILENAMRRILDVRS
jgi:hypothetical protein